MFKRNHLSLIIISLLCMQYVQAQVVPDSADTLKETQLQEVVVKAFAQNRKLKEVPAAVNIVSKQALEHFSPVSIVAAVNTTPGVHMEERSPGSYRFNIRGSSLRSPFGVRNVKIYFNDIPITDPGGNTYLNQLGYYNFNSIEIIKGPGSSLYGAGTGGVMLIESMSGNEANGVNASYTTGSYGLQNAYGNLITGNDDHSKNSIGFQHQQNNGYRDHSALRRDVLSWSGRYRFSDHQQLNTTFLYGDLYYQTPGALTLAEYNNNPKAARPGSDEAEAAIYQKTFIAGASYTQQLTSWLENKSVLYGAFTQLKNPNLRGYDRSSEPHVGGRSVFTVNENIAQSILTLNAGAEWQQGFTTASSYKNIHGNADSLRYFDDINNRQSLVFAQASLEVQDWIINAGASLNQLRIRSQRFDPAALGQQSRRFNNEIAPRFSLLKKLNRISLYTSVAKGFSSPTKDELFPTGGTINTDLNAEHGINYDLGLRGTFFNGLYVDVNGFIYSLNNAIVRRIDAYGGDFYVNAGKTRQHGVETYISYPLFKHSPFISRSFVWLSHTWHDFHYASFKQANNDYSGNRLPAEPLHSLSAGADVFATNGVSGTATYYYSSKVPLNDANTAYAKAYHLIGLKIGYNKMIKNKTGFQVFAGVENLLNQTYSLGNDINGFGGRYYNAAPGRNYYAGVSFHLDYKNHQ